jgi:hypothetical protein
MPRTEYPWMLLLSREAMGRSSQATVRRRVEGSGLRAWFQGESTEGGKVSTCTSPVASTPRASRYRDWQV